MEKVITINKSYLLIYGRPLLFTDKFKTEYIKTFAKFCNKDEIVYHGLVHSRNVKPVKIISGAKNEGR